MTNIIVAFSRAEDGRNIKNILIKNGLHVTASCVSGSQVLACADDLRCGIVVCGFRFADMACRQLGRQLPPGFDMLLIASPLKWSGEDMGEIVCLPTPFKVCDLISTVRMIEQMRQKEHGRRSDRSGERSEEDKKAIEKAKGILIVRNRMTEPEAHRYLQKCSMDSQTGIAEAARMVLSLYG